MLVNGATGINCHGFAPKYPGVSIKRVETMVGQYLPGSWSPLLCTDCYPIPAWWLYIVKRLCDMASKLARDVGCMIGWSKSRLKMFHMNWITGKSQCTAGSRGRWEFPPFCAARSHQANFLSPGLCKETVNESMPLTVADKSSCSKAKSRGVKTIMMLSVQLRAQVMATRSKRGYQD